MNLLILLSTVLTAPALAWAPVYDGYSVVRFVERSGKIWALPGLVSSSNGGLSWTEDGDMEGVDDCDVMEGHVASTYDDNYFDVDGKEDIPQTISLSHIRFIGDRLFGLGSPRYGEDYDGGGHLSEDRGFTWKKTLNVDLLSAEFFVLDGKRAWLAADEGIWRTADCGRSWQKAATWARAPQAIFFLDKKRGWLVDGNEAESAVYASSDGGESWSKLSAIAASSGPVQAVVFADRDRGWAAARGEIWMTADGGSTWNPLAAPSSANFSYYASLHHGRKGRTEYLLLGTLTEHDRDEPGRRIEARGGIYRMELKRP